VGDALRRLYPLVLAHLAQTGARPGLCVAYYDEPADDGSVEVHAGFDIADQNVSDTDDVSVVDLPVIEVASFLHHGSMANVVPVYEALVRWIEESGHGLAGRSRELYLERDDDKPDNNVTELQMPIGR
jgi:effector-binding domain-containing protein